MAGLVSYLVIELSILSNILFKMQETTLNPTVTHPAKLTIAPSTSYSQKGSFYKGQGFRETVLHRNFKILYSVIGTDTMILILN